MTREEAIDLLDNLIGMVEDNHNSDYDMAFKMAIKSLEQERSAIDELIRALNYDRKQYEKGYADGRMFGKYEFESKLVHLQQCHTILKEQLECYGEKRAAEYKECIKRQVCSEIGRYLYENGLVTFTELDGFDNNLIIRADVQLYDENKGDT